MIRIKYVLSEEAAGLLDEHIPSTTGLVERGEDYFVVEIEARESHFLYTVRMLDGSGESVRATTMSADEEDADIVYGVVSGTRHGIFATKVPEPVAEPVVAADRYQRDLVASGADSERRAATESDKDTDRRIA